MIFCGKVHTYPTVPNAETTSNNNLINDMFGLIIDNIKSNDTDK